MLNTSFNLHGLPVVRDVDDAFTFENSDLDFLIIEKMMFKKNKFFKLEIIKMITKNFKDKK